MLGASFVGWVTYKEDKSLRVIINKQEHLIPLEGGEIGEETYRNLIKNLMQDGQTV